MSKRNNKAQKLFKKPRGEFKAIDLSNRNKPKWMTRAFENNMFVVMINDNANTTKGSATLAMVQKLNDTPILNHWKEMQGIKNEIFGSEKIAIEYYPKQKDLIDDKNIYWMWVFDEEQIPVPIL